MVFDKTDTKLTSFINQASSENLSMIASLVFGRVGTLEPREQDQFIQEVQRDPEAKRVFQKMQAFSR